MIGDLDVDAVGWNYFLPRPAFLNDLNQLLCDINAPAVLPAILKPLGQFLRGVLIEHIDVEFTLFGKTRKRQIARSQKSRDRIVRILPEAKVELGVKGVAEIEFNDDLALTKLVGQAAQAGFVFVRRRAQHELVPELFSQHLLESKGRLVVEGIAFTGDAERVL